MSVKLPHMPLWVYDIDTSRFCRRLSDADFGRYMRLLLLQWIEGKVPADTDQAMHDAGIEPTAKEETERLLSEKFPVSGDGKCRQNERLATEREAAVEKVIRNRENGRKGGRPKKQPDKRTVSQKKPNGSIRASDSDSVSKSSEGGSGGKQKPRASNLPDPPGILKTERFLEAWGEYQQHRREIKKPMTPKAAELALKKLQEMGHDRAIESLRNSIANGWTGIFPPDSRVGSKNGSSPEQLTRIRANDGRYDKFD